jgi:hypothetical protein
MFDLFRSDRRPAPLTNAEWRTVESFVPYVCKLPGAARTRLGGLVRRFLEEKQFDGGGGFVVTDEMKLVIAAEACLLLAFRSDEVPYPELLSVVVYEGAWKTTRRTRMAGVVAVQEGANSGESWSRELVILSWKDLRENGVVFHEFAHQLDAADGAVDGAPELPTLARYAQWSRIFGAEFERLVARFHRGLPSDIDPYATTNPAEFFAVVTEEFYERPAVLAGRHPELFAELETFYGVDPRTLAASPT